MDGVEPLERRTVYAQVAESLLRRIADGGLSPGDPLPTERELTQRYRVGRSSVREALRTLESRGLIVSAGKGAFRVAGFDNPLDGSLGLLLTLDAANMAELYELRRILECEAAGLAAARRDDGHLASMDAAIREMADGLAASGDDGSSGRYVDADLRFHLAVAEAAGNRLVLHSMQAVRSQLRRALRSVFLIPGSPERSLAHHRSIRDAIGTADADAARSRMRLHLESVESDVGALLGTGVIGVPGEAGAVSGTGGVDEGRRALDG